MIFATISFEDGLMIILALMFFVTGLQFAWMQWFVSDAHVDKLLDRQEKLQEQVEKARKAKATPAPKPARKKKPATRKKAAAAKTQIPARFKGEHVEEKGAFGVVYKSRPKEVDDLKRISGVGKVIEKKLHENGVYRFKQIAVWKKAQMDAFDQQLNFSGRIQRDEWVKQAKAFEAE